MLMSTELLPLHSVLERQVSGSPAELIVASSINLFVVPVGPVIAGQVINVSHIVRF